MATAETNMFTTGVLDRADIQSRMYYCKASNGLGCLACILFRVEGKYNSAPTTVMVTPTSERQMLTLRDMLVPSITRKLKVGYLHFLVTEAQPEKRIDLQLDRSQTYQIQKNREKTKAILQPLIFCGSYGLNIRGKVDHGDVIIGENATSGVYRGLLTFLYRQETRSLKAKLKTAKKNTLCPRKKRPPSMFKNY